MLRDADPTSRSVLAGLLLLSATLAGCGRDAITEGSVPAPETAGTPPHAAYVLLAESPAGEAAAFARVIVEGDTQCPELVDAGGGGEPAKMTPRRNPHGFPVRVCEAVYPFGRSLSVAGTGITLPAVTREPTRVAVFGDTGCKPEDQGGCTDPAAWPLKTFADAAADSPPDLVLHMGDYNYRGTSAHFVGKVNGQPVEGQWVYDAGDGAEPSEKCEVPGPYYSQNSSGSEDPDNWNDWWLDFFEPAGELLSAAPWVFTRGNHELCSHAGPGWFYFLDAGSDLPEGGGQQLVCPPQDGVDGPSLPHLRFAPPYTVRLAGLDVSVLDSANACDELPNFTDTYRQQLAALESSDTETRWLVMHRPIWGVDGTADDAGFDCAGQPGKQPQQPYSVINKTLQCALAGEVGDALLPEIDLVLAGHMHRFESLTFSAAPGWPPLLVIGNSGVEMNTDAPHGSWAQVVDDHQASGFALEQFGYLEMVRGEPATWHGQMVALDPSAWAEYLPTCGAPGAAEAPLCVKGL